MPGNGGCIGRGLTCTGSPVCVRRVAAPSGWSSEAGSGGGESCPRRRCCLTRGHPSSTRENPGTWPRSSGSCTGSFDAALTSRAVWRGGSRRQERDSPLSRSRLGALRFPAPGGPPAPGTDYIPQRAPRPAASTAPRYWPPRGRSQWGAGILAGAGRAEVLPAAGAREGRGEDRATPDGMGGSESSQGGRKVSFGLDERDRVRVLQGIRLTEDVVNRMKGSSPSRRENQRSPRASNGTAPSSLAAEGKPRPTGILPPKASDSSAEQELYRRYMEEQTLVQEELLRLAKREREAASEAKERISIIEERQRAAQLPVDLDAWAVELQGWEADLKRQEAFYQEQLARIEKKNAEIYKMTSEQYQEAATKAEERIKRRNADPICANLQSEILKCYQENKREVLKCSELAKEYQRCVSAAQKQVWIQLMFGPTSKH
ncbi:MICOS complex subunit MIC25 isoform X3 [Motacilla alba alba]|uniref:MICOS complex subunit MIC25 isoform X3 n=1 Tax=Motacilla alba alba TaxID=1094192 RepID=UPI0018D52DA1|nr:MICOS complex subunit MIC25 isoform X3 [Motacilla alba alba]